MFLSDTMRGALHWSRWMVRRADMYVIGTGERGPCVESGVAGVACATLGVTGAPATIEVFAADSRRLQTLHDQNRDRAIYLWGMASHPEKLSGDALLGWCDKVLGCCPESIRQLLGNFVLIIDDRRQQRVSFVSDILALRPWFVGAHAGRLVAGSDVLRLCEAGWTSGRVNYDAIGSWLLYNFDCTGGSVSADYHRLPPASVWTFDARGKQLGEHRYASVSYARNVVPPEQLVDDVHALMSRKFDQLMSHEGLSEVSLPLSGGYDSRYLCALAARRGGPRVHGVTIATCSCEIIPAKQVAQVLDVPLRVINGDRQVLDLFDDPFHFGGDGFAAARHLSAAVARLNPGMCLLSGLLGDVLMRAPTDPAAQRIVAIDNQPADYTDSQLADAAHKRFRVVTNRIDLLRDGIAQRAQQRARGHLIQWIQAGRAAGRPLAYTNLNTRLRIYMGGIFLGHLDTAETILPFCIWDLLDFCTQRVGSFLPQNYQMIFQRHFPELAHVPHDSQLKSSCDGQVCKRLRRTRHLRGWSADLLRDALVGNLRGSAVVPHKLLARLPAGLIAESPHQTEIMFLHKIRLFEQRVRSANLRLDWSEM